MLRLLRGGRLRVVHQVGRRGVFLLFVALLAAALALSMTNPSQVQAVTLGRVIPPVAWSIVWAAAAVLCLIQAFTRRDQVAFAVISCVVTVWASMYLVGWLTGVADRGWLAATIYYALAVVALVISTWPEPLRMPTAVPSGYPDAVVTADAAGHIIGWGGAAEQVFGWTEDEVTGRPVTMLMPVRYRAPHLAGLAQVALTGRSRLAGQTIEAAGLRRDGSEFPVQLLVGVYDVGGVPAFTTVIRELEPRP